MTENVWSLIGIAALADVVARVASPLTSTVTRTVVGHDGVIFTPDDVADDEAIFVGAQLIGAIVLDFPNERPGDSI